MFGNPVPFHYVAQAEKLPTFTIVANNRQWLAERQSTLAVYPEGAAAKDNVMPVTELSPSPAFEKVIEACGGYGEKVEAAHDLKAALKRTLDKVRGGTPALLNGSMMQGTR